MATIEEIKNELNKAEARLDEAVKELKEWEKGEDDGVLLKKLRRKRKELDEEDKEEKERLEEKEKKLEESKERWEKQVEELQKMLVNSGKELEQAKRKAVEFQLLYEKEKRKKSRLEDVLYATTHSLSKLWKLYTPSYCQTLWFRPSSDPLSFDAPPTGNKESEYQEYFTEKILIQFDDNDQVKVIDSHAIMFLEGKAPDVSTHLRGYPLTSHTVEVIGDIKPLNSCFTPTSQGQILQYAIIALKHQKNRQEITGFLTNCHHIMFIRVTKDEGEEGPYKVYYSNQMSLSNENTSKYLRGLLSTIHYHPMTGLEVELGGLIAYTPISDIYSVVGDDNAVVKVVNEFHILENEVKILKKLESVADEGIIKLITSSKTAMLLKPRAISTFKESQKPVSALAEIVEKLHICHKIGIVHGDVRLNNILVCDNGRLLLADFGCGSNLGEEWSGNGPTTLFRSLQLTKAKPPVYIQCQDDLFTLVQSLYIHLHEEMILENDIIDPNDDLSIIKFWENVFMSGLWKSMYDCCEKLEYEKLKNHILGLDQMETAEIKE